MTTRMAALLGPVELTLDDGCLQAGDHVLVWPPEFSVSVEGNRVTVTDGNAGERAVWHVGDAVWLGGGEISRTSINAEAGQRWLGACEDASAYWLVGGINVTIPVTATPPAPAATVAAAPATPQPASGQGATMTPLPTFADLHSPFAGNLPLTPQFLRSNHLSFINPLDGWAVMALQDPNYPIAWALVYRTNDGGQHWEALSAPEALIYPSELAPYLPALNRIRFFSALEGELTGTHRFVTTDGGLTWQNTGPYDPQLAPVTLEAGQFRLAPGDCAPVEPPDYLTYTDCQYQLQRLSGVAWQTAGWSFTAIMAHLTATDPRAAWIVAYTQAEPGSPPTGHLWRTQDGGQTWEALPDLPSTWPLMYDTWQWIFAPADAQNIWLVSGDAGAGIFGGKVLYVSNDGGRTWSLRAQTAIDGTDRFGDIPVPGYFLGFTAVTAEQAYMVRGRASFLVTRDGGRTWQEAIPEYVSPGDDHASGPIVFLDDRHGWAITGDAVYRTTDGGDTWQPGSVPGLPGKTPLPPTPTALSTGYPGDTPLPPSPTPLSTGYPVVPTPTACAHAWFMANPPAGCPDQPAIYAQTIAQRFEGGLLLWRAIPDIYGSQIYAFFQDGQWPAWNPTNDQWRQGQPESDPALVPPAGLYQPVRGFGLFWREAFFNPAGAARDRLGWALEPEVPIGERPLQCRVQGDWAAGCFLGGPGDQILLVEANNAWSIWTGPAP